MKTIQLTQGQVALVDDEDYEWLNQWKWYANKSYHRHIFYAKRNCQCPLIKQRCSILMHRVIMKGNCSQHIDHIDHNGCNNQKSNMRFVTFQQNSFNSRKIEPAKSIYKGLRKVYNKWQVRITINYKTLYLGTYFTEKEAAEAYNKKATELFGEYALLNKI